MKKDAEYEVTDVIAENKQISYRVRRVGDCGSFQITSEQARKHCLLNAIKYLESKVVFRNSLPLNTVIEYGEYLKKYI